jgi:hypothetical protein
MVKSLAATIVAAVTAFPYQTEVVPMRIAEGGQRLVTLVRQDAVSL